MTYQVIARRYRPQVFASVVGQDPIVTTLKNALRLGRLAHAYLFCGCRGTGKTTLARLFAKALNCQRLTEDFEPCNQCPSCLDVTSGRSLDVLEIDGASNRGIDDIRQLNETVGYAPALGRYKVYIIDEVHMLTKEAFNALLKTLEEPPPHVKFFFATTEPNKVLPTILSRCQRFDLGRIPFEILKKRLLWITQELKSPCDEEVLSLIALLAEGSQRDAESLLDQILCYAEAPITLAKVSSALGIVPRTLLFSLDKAFHEQDLSYAFTLSNDLFLSGKELTYFLDQLTEHFRTLLKFKLDPALDFPSEKLKEHYTSSSQFYTQEQCLYILDFLIQAQLQFHKSSFKRVHLETILLHLIRSKQRITLPSLVRRLQELEGRLGEAGEVSSPQLKSTQVTELPQKEEQKRPTEEIKPSEPKVKLEETPKQLQQDPEEKPSPPSSAPDAMDELLLSKMQKKLETLPEQKPPLFLSKTEWENRAKAGQEVSVEQKAPPAKEASPQGCHYDTLVRFAAVELEGVIKNPGK